MSSSSISRSTNCTKSRFHGIDPRTVASEEGQKSAVGVS